MKKIYNFSSTIPFIKSPFVGLCASIHLIWTASTWTKVIKQTGSIHLKVLTLTLPSKILISNWHWSIWCSSSSLQTWLCLSNWLFLIRVPLQMVIQSSCYSRTKSISTHPHTLISLMCCRCVCTILSWCISSTCLFRIIITSWWSSPHILIALLFEGLIWLVYSTIILLVSTKRCR